MAHFKRPLIRPSATFSPTKKRGGEGARLKRCAGGGARSIPGRETLRCGLSSFGSLFEHLNPCAWNAARHSAAPEMEECHERSRLVHYDCFSRWRRCGVSTRSDGRK